MTIGAASRRIAALDFVRGVAVLGILAVNIGGFAGPMGATLSPHVPEPSSPADEAMFAAMLLLFEGKMRMLFAMLFGASMTLFTDRADAAGRNGTALQCRRLGWLALFGAAHYLLLWWGDILFAYAVIGFAALALRRQPVSSLVVIAAMLFIGWALFGLAATLGEAVTSARLHAGLASAREVQEQARSLAGAINLAQADLAEYRQGFLAQIASRLHRPFWLIGMAMNNVWEILPMMLIGMALQRTGFFAGQWPQAVVRRMARAGIVSGGALSLLIVGWTWKVHFPPGLMGTAIGIWFALPHLLMALGYAAALVLIAPRAARGWLGQRIEAAGRMAFSNYLGTTLLMTTLFSGWGLGLIGRVSEVQQAYFVLLGWALMLGWSAPWLAHFRQGPLEWLWRSLTEWRVLPMRRA